MVGKSIAMLLLIPLLASCATWDWQRNGVRAQRSKAECRYETTKVVGFDRFDTNWQRSKAFALCMQLKGFRFQPVDRPS